MATHLPFGALIVGLAQCPRVLDHGEKPSREFMNAVLLAKMQGLVGQQFAAQTDRSGSSEDEVGRCYLVNSSGRNEGNLRKGDFERAYVLASADGSRRKYLDEISAGLPRSDDLTRRQCSWKYHYVGQLAVCDNLSNKTRTGEKPRACVNAPPRGLLVQHRASSNNQIRIALGQIADYSQSSRNCEGDLDDGNPSAVNRLGGKERKIL